jgi:hypothetical protein
MKHIGIIEDTMESITKAKALIIKEFDKKNIKNVCIEFEKRLTENIFYESYCQNWLQGLEGDVILINDMSMPEIEDLVESSYEKDYQKMNFQVRGKEGLFAIIEALKNKKITRLFVFVLSGEGVNLGVKQRLVEYLETHFGAKCKDSLEPSKWAFLDDGRQVYIGYEKDGQTFAKSGIELPDCTKAFVDQYEDFFRIDPIKRVLDLYGKPWNESWGVKKCYWHHDEDFERYANLISQWLGVEVRQDEAKALGMVYSIEKHPFYSKSMENQIPENTGTWVQYWTENKGKKYYEAKTLRKEILEAAFQSMGIEKVVIHGDDKVRWRLPITPGLPFLVALKSFLKELEKDAPAEKIELMYFEESTGKGFKYNLVISLADRREKDGVMKKVNPFDLAKMFYLEQPGLDKGVSGALECLIWCESLSARNDEEKENKDKAPWKNLFAGRKASPDFFKLPAPPVALYLTPYSVQLYWT